MGDKTNRKYKYTVRAYDISGMNKYINETIITLYASLEKSAISQAKKLVDRNCYDVTRIDFV